MSGEQPAPAATPHKRRWPWLRAPLLSPKGFLFRATAITLAYGVLYTLGWRACTTIICGTTPGGSATDLYGVAKGCAYVLIHFMFVLGVPVLLLAAGFFALFLRWSRPAQPISSTHP